MEKQITITVNPDSLEYAVQSIGILARGLTDAFDLSCVSMIEQAEEEKDVWFAKNYDLLNGGLSTIQILTEIIAEAMEQA